MKQKILLGGLFVLSLSMSVVSLSKFIDGSKSSASVVKNYNQASEGTGLPDVVYNGEKMYVAKASFFDYYGDSEVGTTSTPNAITDGIASNLNTFGKFNTRLLDIMKYGDKTLSPAKYPMYQGAKSTAFSDYSNIFSLTDNSINEKSNYWVGANYNQIGNYATFGLVDSKLSYSSTGVSYLTQSNPDTSKSAYVPYFDKKVLTENKHEGSALPLGEVKENVAFPFRSEKEDGVTYYEFDSSKDTVRFNANNQLDYLGKDNKAEQVNDALGAPGFFPYNKSEDDKSNKLNFGFGVKIEVPFNMTDDGKINGKDIIFEFSGDDDVWVFIDGKLALDLGGCHPKVTGSINFANNEIYVSGVKNNKVAFASRTMNNYGTGLINKSELGLVNVESVYKDYKASLSDDLKNALADTSKVHTLTMFYMERGKNESNMKLKFNLPEPNMLTVKNKVVTDEVGETFRQETKTVAASDNFVYDVVDKNISKKAEIDLLNGENVAFIEEFNEKDTLIVQERALKITDRKLTEMYKTTWTLSDKEKEITNGTGVVVDDIRTSDKSVLFQNSNGAGVPRLDVVYTNKPQVGKFMLACSVTDKYKKARTDYKNKEFKYVVSYAKVFGGQSKEVNYVGKYIVYKEDDTNVERETKDGVISLKPGEKALIVDIPVRTDVMVKAQQDVDSVINQIRSTNQFTTDKNSMSAKGTININSNIVEFINGVKEEKEKEDTKLSDGEIKNLTGEDIPKAPTVDKPINTGGYDDVPKTADETNMVTWAIILGISILLSFGSAYTLIKNRKKEVLV